MARRTSTASDETEETISIVKLHKFGATNFHQEKHLGVQDTGTSELDFSPIPNGTCKVGGQEKRSDATNDAMTGFGNRNVPVLCSASVIAFLAVWYFFSFTTLFLNKYILSYENGDPTALGMVQLLMCVVGGYMHMRYPCNLYKQSHDRLPQHFSKNVFVVGILRFTTVLLGLVALWYVPVSFAETVKSSAPVFTVLITYIVMKEKTSWLVNLTLIPVMGGLALCSANELKFNLAGFIASLATNLSECFQNVYSKMLLSSDKHKYIPPELQFYTSLSSIIIQIPAAMLLVDLPRLWMVVDSRLILAFLLDGISFHFQSITEYTLLGYISPVTHSVANTAKRALLIWMSVLTFGNPVTFLSALGTCIVILGVFMYNQAMQLAVRQTYPISKSAIHNI